MRILHVVPGLDDPTNGIAVAAKLIAAEQSKSGDEAEVIDTRGFVSSSVQPSTFNLQPLSAYAEIWVHSMWLPITLKACWKVLRPKRANLHSTTTTSNCDSSPRLVRMTHANLDPLRYRYHGWKKRLVAPIERWLFKHTDRVVVTCEAEKKWCQEWGLKNEFEILDLKKFFDLKENGNGEGRKESLSQSGHEWYDIIDPQKILGMPIVDISNAAYLSDRKEIKLAFHAFGRVVNEADGRMVVFPAASAGKMWFNSGTDIRGIAAEFANLFRRSLRAWSEPNAKIPVADKRRKLEAVHQYLAKFSNAGGEYYVRFTVKENIGGKSPRAEVHASVISSIHVYKKTEGAELSIPIKTQAEGSAPFVDNKIALFLGAVNGGNANRNLHLLYLGRRHPLKGVEFLERAVTELNHHCTPTPMTYASFSLRIVSNAFGEEKEKVWDWCDVLVLPTLSDNFGLVVAEALERGKRVITTDGAPVWAPPLAAEAKSEYPPSEASCAAGAMRGVEVEQWRERLFYLKGYRDGTDEERVRLLKDALVRLALDQGDGHA